MDGSTFAALGSTLGVRLILGDEQTITKLYQSSIKLGRHLVRSDWLTNQGEKHGSEW